MRTDLQKPPLIVRLMSKLQRFSPRARKLRRAIDEHAIVEGDDPFKGVVAEQGQELPELARQQVNFEHDRAVNEMETETQPDRPDVLKGAVEHAGGLVYEDYTPKQAQKPPKHAMPEDDDDGL